MAKSALKSKKEALSAREIAKRRILAARRAAATRLAHKKEAEEIARRNVLVEQYMPYATSIANRVAKSLASSVDYDDILCNARFGLMEAAKRYDESQNIDFRTFSYYRIKGAIYDGLRKSGWLPRSVYARIKFEEASNDYLQFISEHGQTETVVKDDGMFDTVNTLASIYVISLDANEDIEIEDEGQGDIEKKVEFHQVRKYMREALAGLPPKERQLIMMYYFQNKTLEEAGERLNLSKSWTSRLHARALEILMKRIRALTAHGGMEQEQEIVEPKEI